jgi:hypothetical protein
MQPKKQDVGLSSLEDIMEFMDEEMLKRAMSKMKKPDAEVAQNPGESEPPEDSEISQPVPMAEEKPEDDMDEEAMRQLMEHYQTENV